MATCGTFTRRLAIAYVSRRDAVDHDKGIADERGFDGGGSAGDDRGAGMEERGAGVVDQTDGEPAAEFLDHAQNDFALGRVERGRNGIRNS